MELAEKISILLVEDDPDYGELIQEILQLHGRLDFCLRRADRLSRALQYLAEDKYDIILLDLGLPDSLGLDTLEGVLPGAGEVPIIVLTGLDDETVGMKAVQSGAQDFVTKSDITGPLLSRSILYAIERKQSELSVEWEREYFRSFLESMSDWVWEMNLEGVHTYSNPAVEKILGYTPAEVMGKNATKFWPKDDSASEQRSGLKDQLAAGKPWKNFPCRFLHKDGSVVHLESTGIPIRDAEGKLIGYRGVDRDITERRKAADELEGKNAQLETANKQMSEFVSIVSHDFGNPLGIIQASVELMLLGAYGELGPKLREKAESIFATVQRMNKLRRDTLELSRMDLGKFRLDKQEGDLCALISRVVEQLELQAEDKGQKIQVDCKGPVVLHYDPDHMYRVVENYLSNAIRYSGEGSEVQLDVETGRAGVTVKVRDQGRGIPEGELDKVFLRFYRTGPRVPGSTGLGLSIVKGIVEAHGGKVWAESEGEGKGSTFFFTLPK